MTLLLIGLSHHTTPVAIREHYSVRPSELSGLNEKLVRSSEIDEAAPVCTCNRTELLVVSRTPEAALERAHAFMRHELGDGSARPSHLYELREADAVLHLFRVAASLNSMVLGEAQILGQVKLAYRAGVAGRSVGPILNRLFQSAFRAAKRVRSETGLGASPVSVARIGVDLARELFESLEGKRVLLLGAGEMAESALRSLQEAGAGDSVVLSRSSESATRLARKFAGRAGSLEALPEELGSASVVLCSLQVDRPVVSLREIESSMRARQGRPLLLVDLGLPRNVDPAVNELENVYLYDLDDLEEVAKRGRAQRGAAIESALAILYRERDRFEGWLARLPLVPTIRELLAQAHELARAEARRAAGSGEVSTNDSQEAFERMAETIVAKLLHRPLKQLRAESEAGAGPYYAEAVRRLCGLELEDEEE